MSENKEIVDKIDKIIRSNLLFSGMTYSDTLECAEEIYEDIIKKEIIKEIQEDLNSIEVWDEIPWDCYKQIDELKKKWNCDE